MTKIKENFLKFFKTLNLKVNNIIPSFFLKKKQKVIDLPYRQHFDSTKTIEEKILIEKRKRHQAYTALDYLLSLTTYFDFFSTDAFQIAKDAKNFAQINEEEIVTSEYLLLPFFYTNSKISESLKTFGITKEKVQDLISISENEKSQNISFFENFLKNLQSYSPLAFKSLVPNPELKYSLEVNRIFEKASENALERFKTPVIGTEILFITLMEENKTKVGKILKKLFKSESDWFLLRYNLIKTLHLHESYIRNEINSNQHYFAYLLKSRLSDFQFQSLLENGYFSEAIFSFRNQLISEAVKVNIYDLLEQEVYDSIRINRKKANSTNRFGDIQTEKIS